MLTRKSDSLHLLSVKILCLRVGMKWSQERKDINSVMMKTTELTRKLARVRTTWSIVSLNKKTINNFNQTINKKILENTIKF